MNRSRKTFSIMSAMLALTQLFIAMAAHADVCQKDGEYSIRMMPMSATSDLVAVVSCPVVGPCYPYSLFNGFFSKKDLLAARKDENEKANKSDVSLSDLFTIAAVLASGSESARLTPAARDRAYGPSDEETRAKAAAKENLSALDKLLDPTSSCIDVPSIDSYKDILVRRLNQIPTAKIVESSDPKEVKPAPGPASTKVKPGASKGAH